ncbi:MAG: hypothetical protein ACRBBS_02560 [Thalassovita sp.]
MTLQFIEIEQLSVSPLNVRKPADPNWIPRYMAFPQGSYREAAVAPATEKTKEAA